MTITPAVKRAALILLFTCAVSDAWAVSIGNVNILLAGKTLNKKEWEPADKQGEFGVEFDLKAKDWPVSLALDILGANGEGKFTDPVFGRIKAESRTSEIQLGVKKIWDTHRTMRPFIGGGITLAAAQATLTGATGKIEDTDNGSGLWLGGGIYWQIGSSFNLGFEAKASAARVKLFNDTYNAGGGHFGLLLGYHWGND